MRTLAAALLWLLAALPAAAEEVVAAFSQTRVQITTSFDGVEIFVYGAIKRSAPVPPDSRLDVIVTLTGPSEPVIVRQKTRQFGIWVNDEGIKVQSAPSFYAVASTRPLEQAVSHVDNLRHGIGLEQIVQLIGPTHAPAYPGEYREALIRLRRERGIYSERPGSLTIDEDTLFRTSIALPAQLVEGDYTARIFLVRDGAVVDVEERTVAVRKVGLERWIYTMAKERSLIYGLLSIAVALAAGWGASALFRYLLP